MTEKTIKFWRYKVSSHFFLWDYIHLFKFIVMQLTILEESQIARVCEMGLDGLGKCDETWKLGGRPWTDVEKLN
jgi:hypothetical protein